MTRKLKQVVGLRQAVMSMRVLRHVQANDALQGATRNHNGVAHKQANLGGRNLDHRARLAKAIQVDSNAVFAALGHLSTELSKAVPRVAHIVQVGGHVKLNGVLRMQRFMSNGRPFGSRYRMPTGITLMVSIVENAVMSS